MIGQRLTTNDTNRSSRSVLVAAILVLLGGFGLVLDNLFLRNVEHRILQSTEDNDQMKQLYFSPEETSIVEQMRDHLLEDTSRIWEFEDDGRPVMNTFFHPISGTVAKKDAMVIAAWKHGWDQQGWNPRVLSLKDAKKHPQYPEINEQIRQMHPRMLRNEYETMCYLRYIAMAANGGGHMSDYDTIPLHMPAAKEMMMNGTTHSSSSLLLPNRGNFTTYGNHVPALLAGRSEQWDYIAKRLIEEGQKYSAIKNGVFSDMLALEQIIKQNKNEVKVMDKMLVLQPHHFLHIGGFNALLTGEFKKPLIGTPCDKLNAMRAMHISHYTMYDNGFNTNYRGLYMGKVLQQYHDSCGGPEFFNSAKKELLGSNEEETEDKEKQEWKELVKEEETSEKEKQEDKQFLAVIRL